LLICQLKKLSEKIFFSYLHLNFNIP